MCTLNKPMELLSLRKDYIIKKTYQKLMDINATSPFSHFKESKLIVTDKITKNSGKLLFFVATILLLNNTKKKQKL